MATAAAAAPGPCCHCHAYLCDSLRLSLQLAFPQKVGRVTPELLREVILRIQEGLRFSFGNTQAHAEYVKGCQTMETFCGREATVDRFFQSRPDLLRTVEEIAMAAWEAGLGKLDAVRSWIRPEFYMLFQEAVQVHLEHSWKSVPTNLGCPRFYTPPSKVILHRPVAVWASPVQDGDDDLYR